MWVSLCAGQVLFDTVYLLVEWTCASTKCKRGQEVSSAKRLAVRVQDALMRGAVVNRVCSGLRDKVRDTDTDYVMRKPSRCWLGAVPRYWKVVASCFRFISFTENTSVALAPRAGISQPILLLFFLFSRSWICLQNVSSDFFYSVSKFSGVRKKTGLT